jgi:large conductance mechanosensitive channel
MLKGFKEFITRGNVVELAVAVVIGTAFTAVVTSLVADLLTPLIAAIVGEPDFSGLSLTLNGSEILYGSFLNALIAFLSVAVAIYFVVVAPLNVLEERRKRGAKPEVRPCPECTTEIAAAARRCPQCTAAIDPVV